MALIHSFRAYNTSLYQLARGKGKKGKRKTLEMSTKTFQGSKKYELDCQFLHSYLSDNVVNKQKLAEILMSRNLNEFKLICQAYTVLYNQDLLRVLKKTQKNNLYSRAVYLRMSEPQERDAETMRNSLYGGNVNLNTLIEVACTRSSIELQSIKQTYSSQYNSNIDQDVAFKVNGGFKEILLAILKSCRNYGGKVDTSMAMCDAKTLYEAMESGKIVDQKTMISLVSQRNTGQIKAILVSYKQLYGHEFSKSLKRSKCGQFGKELRIVIRCIQHPEKFLAKQLRLKNGDAREILTRIIITRSNVDIKEISRSYAAKTGSSLENFVRKEFNNSKDKASGIVADFLVGLIKG
ncbi:annexin D2-like [Cornus florida]|uniref:annexin D2-like n=1 Tax=Cornus florida TaxID=4283 RepID=UPI00289906AF|nr:annexin D2-like [Cornus florida]